MSFRGMLIHRGELQETSTTQLDGVARTVWLPVATNVPCRFDLSFIRKGKDPQWTPEAGRVEDRSGVVFFPPEVPVKPGQRIICRDPGIEGTFMLEGNVEDIIGRRSRVHHREVGCREVPGPLARGSS